MLNPLLFYKMLLHLVTPHPIFKGHNTAYFSLPTCYPYNYSTISATNTMTSAKTANVFTSSAASATFSAHSNTLQRASALGTTAAAGQLNHGVGVDQWAGAYRYSGGLVGGNGGMFVDDAGVYYRDLVRYRQRSLGAAIDDKLELRSW